MKLSRALQAALCVAATALCATSPAEPRVEFKDNRLKVDGRPFFFYGCWGTPDQDFAEFRRRRFNTAFMTPFTAQKDGRKAADAGLMVMVYPHAPSWNDKMKAAVQSLLDKDWVLAWNIGDDLMKPEHLQAAITVRDEIRAMDPLKRPIAFDAIGRYEEFAKIPDMWCAYAYALVRPAAVAPPAYKPAGLSQYGDWLDRMRLLGRPDGFFWTWAQCHVQVWYNVEYLGGKEEGKGSQTEIWRPSLFPDGDHLRLIAAHAVSSGARGLLWFVSYYFQDDRLGRDRYARAAVIGCELEVLGPLIAQGRTAARLKTSDPDVWATPIDFPGGRLICLLKTGDLYHYQPDAASLVRRAATASNVRIETGGKGRLYQIGPDIVELTEPVCSFNLTGWLLQTDDAARPPDGLADADLLSTLRQKLQEVLPDMARFAVEELQARLAKVEPVLKALGREADALAGAQEHLARSRQCLARNDWPAAVRSADEGLLFLRTAQHRVWSRMWSGEIGKVGMKVTDFYLLPRFSRQIQALNADAWDPNALRNGSFETDEVWAGVKVAHDPKGKAMFVSDVVRSGKRSLKLRSDSPTIYEGQPQDWVAVNLVSEKIPAARGELWEVAAWVRVPATIAQTARGVTVALFAYDADGKSLPGFAGPDNESCQVEATADWQRLRRVVTLQTPDVRSVAARLSLCGVGEAYLDDVTVRRLRFPPE